jgi:glutamate synthase domain-containing protein 3
MKIDVKDKAFSEINEEIRKYEEIQLVNCLGQRFIASGMGGKKIVIDGVPGNALGAYNNGSEITVNGNAQDATGDTMNSGTIVIHGNIGDAAGYAMRGGEIYIKGNAGYRAGIHMKEYKEQKPVIVIGGKAGCFLGEYQAGGLIIVLGIDHENDQMGDFPCTGMHGGKIVIRGKADHIVFPAQTKTAPSSDSDIEEIMPFVKKYCHYFGYDEKWVMDSEFTTVTPDSNNPYKQLYVAN